MSYFETRLLELLPSFYRIRGGDLSDFLKIPAGPLDEFKILIDQFPTLFDVATCRPDFLPLLGQLVGHNYDGTTSLESQRRDIVEAVDGYRRKGTIPAIRRSLKTLGWMGHLNETYRKTLRLNHHARPCQNYLAGDLYNQAVYQVESWNHIRNLQNGLGKHHPAGTKAFFKQWFFGEHAPDLSCAIAATFTMLAWSSLREIFDMNRNQLNGSFDLTYNQKGGAHIHLTHSAPSKLRMDFSEVCLNRWMGRGSYFQLNQTPMNSRTLTNLWVNENKFASKGEIRLVPNQEPSFLLGVAALNKVPLTDALPQCHIKFQQKDWVYWSDVSQSFFGPQMILVRTHASNITRGIRLNQKQAVQQFTSSAPPASVFQVTLAQTSRFEAEASASIVDRWATPQPGLRFGQTQLNQWQLTNASVNESRASMEVMSHIPHPNFSPFPLNQQSLNLAALRFSGSRLQTMRLSGMPLNLSGFPVATPMISWRLQQHNLNGASPQSLSSVVQATLTQWPSE